mmetsp:Transcript_46767/g.109095  ORF Transcript_46767/g.109095 Transcript_46767/m.109095 type:complete len:228 (+) Transcript_46767:304-987(+)
MMSAQVAATDPGSQAEPSSKRHAKINPARKSTNACDPPGCRSKAREIPFETRSFTSASSSSSTCIRKGLPRTDWLAPSFPCSAASAMVTFSISACKVRSAESTDGDPSAASSAPLTCALSACSLRKLLAFKGAGDAFPCRALELLRLLESRGVLGGEAVCRGLSPTSLRAGLPLEEPHAVSGIDFLVEAVPASRDCKCAMSRVSSLPPPASNSFSSIRRFFRAFCCS